MLGRLIADPEGLEGPPGRTVEGLGLIDQTTTFGGEKVLALHDPAYEIHHGHVAVGDADPWLVGHQSGPVIATMRHGSLEDDTIRAALLALARPGRPPSEVRFAAAREERLDRLADLLDTHADTEAILNLIETGAPPGQPILPPAGVQRGRGRDAGDGGDVAQGVLHFSA